MKKRIIALLLMCVMTTGLLLACKNNDDKKEGEGDTIKIGGLAPLSGELSSYGNAANNGILLAVKEVNEAGGINGKQIEYIPYDEKGDATEACNAYAKLVDEKEVVAIIGDVTTNPSIAVAQKSQEDNIPIITATGTGKAITEAGPNVFRACFLDPFQGQTMASYAAKKLNAKTAAILYNTDDDYSTGLTEAFEEEAKANGLDVVIKEGYSKGTVDFSSQLTNIAAKNADVFFIPVYYEDVAKIAPAAKNAGINSKLLGADGWDGVIDKLDESNYDSVSNIFFCNHYAAERIQDFIKKYTEEYNSAPASFAALGYDAAMIMINAIKNAGSTDSAAIIEQLNKTNYSGLTGDITFDSERNPIKTAFITSIAVTPAQGEEKAKAEYKFIEVYSK